ncbi:hypothetical protein [Nocardioides jensenii]|uniref:hypothetical protein n=1 Tax=Nocardioides jensenii TaxID=1843 RepID=UPI00082C8AE8|nr:hypothetical protein [Nocardioides jensenii]
MRSINTLTLAVACAALLTGCNADDDSAPADDAWKPDSSVPTEPGDDGFTRPGAVLAPAASARVPFLDDGFGDEPDLTGSLEISDVQVPVEGERDAIPSDQAFSDELDGTPYYVTFTAKNTGETDLSGTVIRLTAVDVEGDTMATWASSSLEPCPGAFPADFGPGATATICSVVFVDDDDLAAVGYDRAPDYEDDPVLWDLT